MASSAEVDAMRRALALASSVSDTHPNPRVGAVVLNPDGRVVGEGWHRAAGRPHAEIEALTEAGAAASGGTVVVTLEPCRHTGRTGPCTKALVSAGVARVVFAQSDPNPLAAGGGAELAAAALAVESGVLADEARALNPWWSLAMERRRPFVTWKTASTVDGRVAAADGSSRWITGPEARAQVHRLRSAVDAVVVGIGTVLADDPQLTARAPDGSLAGKQPLRVVVGRRPVPAGAAVHDDSAPTLELATHDVAGVLTELFDRGVHTALLEGGPTLAAAFIGAGAVDRVVGYLAPAALGAGHAVLESFGVGSIGEALRFEFSEVARVGSDLRWVAELQGIPGLPSPFPSEEGAA
jgi:diaminohydroxyphosphoribosylaminopyrimidine deaminase/5-amino-6-(5-phosphoribosylamino)uracil reductase